MARNFYYYKDETSGEYLLIPFDKVLGVLKQDRYSSLKVFVGDGTDESAFHIDKKDADQFTNDYANWLNSKDSN